jgi:tetratricopeptide (TPR) repeat protein
MARQISLCMIARNEEANLPGCLEPVAGLVDEIVLVDTGSSDRTRKVAAGLGARVFDFPWIDDFAAARNESLRHATCPRIFWLDADDRIDDANRRRLQVLFGGLDETRSAYLMKCQGVSDAATGAASVTEHVRVFPNHPQARWHYRVHEQILPALRRLDVEVRRADVVIAHTGYRDPALHAQKVTRNLQLLERSAAENPGDPQPLFYLGQTYLMLGEVNRALPLLRACLKFADARNPITPRLYILLTQALYQAAETAEAFAVCRSGRLHFPDNPDLLFLEGAARQAAGDAAGGEACFKRLLDGPAEVRSLSIDPDMHTKARQRLALDFLRQGRLDDAELQWRAMLAEIPDSTQAWLGLADINVARGLPELWQPLLQSVGAVPNNGLNEALVKARLEEARGAYAAARLLLEHARAQYGQSLWPRLALARVLLQEGRDWPAAERALCAVLELQPTHGEARRNLDLVRQRLAAASSSPSRARSAAE